MAIKYKNGTEAKDGDKVVGVDHCNRPCAGIVVKGIPSQGQADLVFKNAAHGAVQPSLALENFLLEADADTEKQPTKPLLTAN